MIYTNSTSAIFLTPSVSSMALEVTSPFLLTIDPRNSLAFEGTQAYKAYKIEYKFNDGTPNLTKNAYVDLFKKDFSLPIFNDPGDPRNYPINHVFATQSSNVTDIFCKIRVYWYTEPSDANPYIEYSVNLKLTPHSLKTGGYFDRIHLGQTRMFGPNNDILYNFEGVNPTYSLPVIVNWKTKEPSQPLLSIF